VQRPREWPAPCPWRWRVVLLCGALAVCPTEAAFVETQWAEGPYDGPQLPLRKGKLSRFLHYFESSGTDTLPPSHPPTLTSSPFPAPLPPPHQEGQV